MHDLFHFEICPFWLEKWLFLLKIWLFWLEIWLFLLEIWLLLLEIWPILSFLAQIIGKITHCALSLTLALAAFLPFSAFFLYLFKVTGLFSITGSAFKVTSEAAEVVDTSDVTELWESYPGGNFFMSSNEGIGEWRLKAVRDFLIVGICCSWSLFENRLLNRASMLNFREDPDEPLLGVGLWFCMISTFSLASKYRVNWLTLSCELTLRTLCSCFTLETVPNDVFEFCLAQLII